MDIRELISFYHTARLSSVSQAARFLHTARLSSVSQAARFLELGQPTVTAHLQRLEQTIGADLFDRNRRPIKLTRQGSKLFELARHLLSSMTTETVPGYGFWNLAIFSHRCRSAWPSRRGGTFRRRLGSLSPT